MNLSVSGISFQAYGSRMTPKELNKVLKNNYTMPLGKKLPKNVERQISPNLFQRICNFFNKIFS